MTTPLSDLPDNALAALARRAERELPDAPQWLVESAVAMWPAPLLVTPPLVAAPGPSLGRRVLAVLGFDSWTAQPTLALRSILPTDRQLLFSVENRDIDLRVMPANPAGAAGGSTTRFVVAGQVLGPGDDGVVSLLQSGETVESVALDDFGEFRFADLPAGAYAVTVTFGSDEIVLPVFRVGVEPQR